MSSQSHRQDPNTDASAGGLPARLWFAATVLAVVVGVGAQVLFNLQNPLPPFSTGIASALDIFFYFTLQSNLIVGVTSLMLAMDPSRIDERRSGAFRVWRLIGVAAIALTGIVYNTLLAGLHELEGLAQFANVFMHIVTPILGVGGWLLFGPRGGTSRRTVLLTVLFPLFWFVVILARAAFVDHYPYPFIDVGELGFGRVMLNAVVLLVVYLGIAALMAWLDRALARRGPMRSQDG